MFVNKNVVICDKSDCFAAAESIKHKGEYHCQCLRDNDFGGKPCPFFKTHEDQRLSLMQVEKRKKELAEEKKQKAKETNIRTISGVIFRGKENRNG